MTAVEARRAILAGMSSAIETLKATVKEAVALAREQRWDEFYSAYARLFQDPDFANNKLEDQRQALKLMIMTKKVPAPTSAEGIAAYQAAWYVLHRLTTEHNEP